MYMVSVRNFAQRGMWGQNTTAPSTAGLLEQFFSLHVTSLLSFRSLICGIQSVSFVTAVLLDEYETKVYFPMRTVKPTKTSKLCKLNSVETRACIMTVDSKYTRYKVVHINNKT